MSFDLNPELSQAIHRLQEVIIQDDDEDSELAGMVDISKVSVILRSLAPRRLFTAHELN